MEMILFVGIPGSGKSTFYKTTFFNSHLRISLDLLKTRNRENKLLEFCFKTSMSFVMDNTNVSKEDRKAYLELARSNKYKVIGYYFKSDIKECLERNEQRVEKERVPMRGMLAKYKKLEIPDKTDGFDELYYVNIGAEGFVVEKWIEN